MCPIFELNTTYKTVEDSDKMPVIPGGTHVKMMIADVALKETNAGRPTLNWMLKVVDSPEYEGICIFYRTPLPWEKEGRLDDSGIGFLVSVCKACGKPWTGSNLVSEEYLGQIVMAEVKEKFKNVQDERGNWVQSEDRMNEIKKFIY